MFSMVRNAQFFAWYNHEHHHSGLGYLTPAMVHHGVAEAVRAQRTTVLAAAYAAHPERFVGGVPQPASLPTTVWINAPPKKTGRQDASGTTVVTLADLVGPLDFVRIRAQLEHGGEAVT